MDKRYCNQRTSVLKHESSLLMLVKKIIIGFIFTMLSPGILSSHVVKKDYTIVLDTESYNACLAQDKEGFLWIATTDGIIKYDGCSKKRYNYNNDFPILSNAVSCLFIDSENKIWFNTVTQGLYSFDKENNKLTSYKYDLHDLDSVSSKQFNWASQIIAEDKDGLIWIGTKAGLSKYNSKTNQFTSYTHDPNNPNSLQINSISFLLSDKDNNLWICHDYDVAIGIERYDITNDKFISYETNFMGKNFLETPAIVSCFRDKNGTLWLLDNRSKIYQLNFLQEGISSFHHLPFMTNSLKSNDVFVIMENNNQDLLFGTKKGISRFDDKTEELINFNILVNNTNLANQAVRILLEDTNGIFWIGTYGGYLYAFDKNKKLIGQYKNNLLTGYMMEMLEDDSDNSIFWIGSEIDGFFKFDKKTGIFKQYKNNPDDPDSLSNNTVLCIFQDKQGIIWLPTLEGVNRFDPITEKFKRYVYNPDDSNSISGNSVVSCCFDSQGNFGLQQMMVDLINLTPKWKSLNIIIKNVGSRQMLLGIY